METKDRRDEIWSQAVGPWDLLIIGGGITGAGLLREAVRLGLRALLVEQRDFAWGTSSRSSKLVHGGLRYLKEGRLLLTRAAVRARQQLLQDCPGLIDPLGFLLTIYKGDFPGRWTYTLGLTVYDLLALRWDHAYYGSQDFQMLAPHIDPRSLQGGFRYGDAQTDDARLVFRLIHEAELHGGAALNYARAESLVIEAGRVRGVRLVDQVQPRQAQVAARVVVNATGAWADRLRHQAGLNPSIRPLRGSHLIFPAWRLPVAQAVSFLHPIDRRPVFIFPWESITLVGTTDVDHQQELDHEPQISPEETAYLMAAVEYQFPCLNLGLEDVISTYAGVRPVIGTGKTDPSRESRDHVIWLENGLLTVTGGKLTTFRLIALEALKAIRQDLPGMPRPDENIPVLDPVDLALPEVNELDEPSWRRLLGRYGSDAPALVASAQLAELAPIGSTSVLWAELRWAARTEAVVHLDDLLLRRTRLGLLLPHGGAQYLPTIRAICQPELGWDNERWEAEQRAYQELWQRCYNIPDPVSVPDWKILMVQADQLRQERIERHRHYRRSAAILLVSGIMALLATIFGLRRWLRGRRKRPLA